MRLLVDSNRYTEFAKGDPAVVARVESALEVFVPVIVLGELRSGFAFGSKRQKNEEVLEKFLASPDIHILVVDSETTNHYASVYSSLRRNGTPIPTNDIWIAALALQHDLTLDTGDSHFQHVPGLKLVPLAP